MLSVEVSWFRAGRQYLFLKLDLSARRKPASSINLPPVATTATALRRAPTLKALSPKSTTIHLVATPRETVACTRRAMLAFVAGEHQFF